jgi:TM2 domain-containing membrane protein YozV
MNSAARFLAVIWFSGAACGAGQAVAVADSGEARYPDTTAVLLSEPGEVEGEGTRSPVVAAALSALVPGLGQVYNRSYVKGGLFLAAEGLMASSIVFWYNDARKHDPVIDRLTDSVELYRDSVSYETAVVDTVTGALDTVDTILHVTIHRMHLDTSRYERMRKLGTMTQVACWAAGCYLYGIMEAIERTGRFADDEPRSPLTAGLLSAVPGLALGQMYNGKIGKAGFIWMMQFGLAYMAANNHRLLRHCERKLTRLADPASPEYHEDDRIWFVHDWEQFRRDAFRERNTYLWYSIFFYLYGIFDAVVDAHLHDYPRRMRLEPDLEPGGGAVGLRMSLLY